MCVCLVLGSGVALIKTLRADYEARTQGSFVEKKLSSVTFHYRNADPVFGLFQGEFNLL